MKTIYPFSVFRTLIAQKNMETKTKCGQQESNGIVNRGIEIVCERRRWHMYFFIFLEYGRNNNSLEIAYFVLEIR